MKDKLVVDVTLEPAAWKRERNRRVSALYSLVKGSRRCSWTKLPKDEKQWWLNYGGDEIDRTTPRYIHNLPSSGECTCTVVTEDNKRRGIRNSDCAQHGTRRVVGWEGNEYQYAENMQERIALESEGHTPQTVPAYVHSFGGVIYNAEAITNICTPNCAGCIHVQVETSDAWVREMVPAPQPFVHDTVFSRLRYYPEDFLEDDHGIPLSPTPPKSKRKPAGKRRSKRAKKK